MSRPYAWEGVLIVFFFLLLLIGLNLLFGAVQYFTGQSLLLSPVLILGELLILALILIWAIFRHLPLQETFYLYPADWRLLGLSMLIAFTWWPVAIGLGTLMEQLFSMIGPPPEIPPPHNTLDAIGYFIAIVILAPLCEEPVFRGLIMRGWLRYGFVAGVVGSGILFGLQHAQLTNLVPLSLVGVVLGIVTFRAGSLWPAILVHATYNGLSIPFLLMPEAEIPEISDATFMLAGLIATPVALAVLWLYHRVAPPFQTPEKETFESEHRVAMIISFLLVLGLFSILALLEIYIRLNPDMVPSQQY